MDLAYNESQHLDLHLVDQPDQPLVVCLHGGGFISGDKDDERCRQTVAMLNESGFNCASITYSLASSDNRFSMWPRNLFDVADALVWLHENTAKYGYNFNRLGMLGYSAGCCLSNLYIQGGEKLFDLFGYQTPVFNLAALVGFYGPYDFPSRQAERRPDKQEINLYHSPSYWLSQNHGFNAPPVLHIQGDQDTVVYPDQHEAFRKDYEQRGFIFNAVILEGFGHSFALEDSNASGKVIDLRSKISDFLSHHLMDKTA
jgi:acetyl esterase/lipase